LNTDAEARPDDGYESDREVWFINRSLVVLRPRQQLVAWVNGVTGGRPELTLAEARKSPTALLIPSFDYLNESAEWMRANSRSMLQVALGEWVRDPAVWPPDLNWSTLAKWFEVESIDAAWDRVDEDLHSDIDRDMRELDEVDERAAAAALEVVSNQLAAGDPPEVRRTLDRLMAAGHPEREGVSLIAAAMLEEMNLMLRDGRKFDATQYAELLASLE
jgi:hypothetical protein